MKLFIHQENVLGYSQDAASYAWFLETGTGKTILSLENMKYLWEHKKINAAIITAPKTVLKPVWLKTLGDFYSGVLPFYTFQWIGEFTESQERLANQILRLDRNPDHMPIFLINIEAFSHTKIYDIVGRVLRHWHVMWIMDESTTIKSPTTKRTKGILKISHLADYKRILSGYPVLKSPEDLYSQIQFLGPHLMPYSSFYAFRNEFCLLKKLDNRVSITIGAKNIDKLANVIQPFTVRLTKKQCLDLPEKIRTVRYIEMSVEQRKYYNQMKEEGYVTIKNNVNSFASTLLVQLEKLHQIANGMILDKKEFFDCYKYKVLVDIIKNEIGDNQVVVWSSYVDNIEFMSDIMECRTLYGETAMNTRDKILLEFNAGKFQILVCNPATAKYGLNLTSAHYSIYFNNSFKLEDRIQSEDRLHRIGQSNKVTYIDLITDDTIEQKVLDTLEKKHSIGAAVLKDEWESWFS